MSRKSNEYLLHDVNLYNQALKATDEELTRMYVKGTNRYAIKEMIVRGIY